MLGLCGLGNRVVMLVYVGDVVGNKLNYCVL